MHPISVIHIDGDDDSDDVDEAVQLAADDSQQTNIMDDSTSEAPVCGRSLLPLIFSCCKDLCHF